MRQIRSIQNDNLDAICYRYFGYSSGALEAICEINPQLMGKPILPVGTLVNLPDANQSAATVAQDTVQLWS